jgi:glutamate-1-semialdehyde 2,1-aminomutase
MDVGGIRNAGAERVFLMSTTHGAEMPALGAFVAALNIYRSENVIEHMWSYGAKLLDGMNAISRAKGLGDHFAIQGFPVSMNYITKDRDGQPSLPMRTLFAQEMLSHGVMMPWISVSLAHGEAELQRTLEAVDKALDVYAEALENGFAQYLQGEPIKPVFRRFN